jgi:CYTH domain-containing protein
MSVEIERKFLVKHLPVEARQKPAAVIEQGYLALEPDGQEVRLRKSNRRFTLTVKSVGELTRREYETELTPLQFEHLWPGTYGRRIRKDRYILHHRGYTIDIDVYHQPLKGLIVAEVEFASLNLANEYVKEPWMGREVTHLNFLKNRRLFEFDSFEDLQKIL